jgi:hypothetical protein
VWAVDITNVEVSSEYIYLAAVMDWFSRANGFTFTTKNVSILLPTIELRMTFPTACLILSQRRRDVC